MNEVINITPTEPKLSTAGVGDTGTIKLNNLPSLDTSSASAPKKSVNFGPGIEMLMNDKRRSGSPKSDIKLADLESLETNINLNETKPTISRKEANAAMFSSLGTPSKENITLKIDEKNTTPAPPPTPSGAPSLGTATAKNENKEKTWDGFKKFNEIPVDPTKPVPVKPAMSNEQILREKLKVLRKLEALQKKGIQLTKQYTMDSPLAEMQGEYEMIKSEKEKSNSVKFQGKMLMAAVSAIEFLNAKFDPFDVKLDGWGESVSENLDDYDEVFGELHEKYGGKTKMAPELKLLFMLGGSAAMLHMTNTMFKSAIPGMDDIMKQNPELMKQFTNAAVNSMQKDSPGMSSFMQGVMNNPPPPREQQNKGDFMQRSRPDISMARDNEMPKKSKRREMKGPSNINDILSGIKTKKINVQKDSDSTISISELKEMKNDLMPQKSKRKQRTKQLSERSVINLNI